MVACEDEIQRLLRDPQWGVTVAIALLNRAVHTERYDLLAGYVERENIASRLGLSRPEVSGEVGSSTELCIEPAAGNDSPEDDEGGIISAQSNALEARTSVFFAGQSRPGLPAARTRGLRVCPDASGRGLQASTKAPPNSRRQAPEQAAAGISSTLGGNQKPCKGRPTDASGAPRTKGAAHRKTLEERIWGAFLDAPRPRPPEKELQEAMAFLKKIDRSLTKKYNVIHAVDVCGGHGLLAMLLLIMGKAKKCYVLDLQFPASAACLLEAFVSAGLLRDPKALVWVQGDIVDTLPELLESLSPLAGISEQRESGVECEVGNRGDDKALGDEGEGIGVGGKPEHTADERPMSTGKVSSSSKAKVRPAVNAVVGIHACNYLTDVIMDAAVEASVPFALMPCCHADRMAGAMKQAAAIVGASLACVVDVARMGSLLERGFACHMLCIPPSITPVNRVLLGTPPPSSLISHASSLAAAGASDGSAAGCPTACGAVTSSSRRFTEKEHEALMHQSSKMVRLCPQGDRQDDDACTERQARSRRPKTLPRRFSPREHLVVIQRALALQGGARQGDVEWVDGLGPSRRAKREDVALTAGAGRVDVFL